MQDWSVQMTSILLPMQAGLMPLAPTLGSVFASMVIIWSSKRGSQAGVHYMTYRCFKVFIGLGAAVLVGCATPLPTPVPPSTSLAPLAPAYRPPAVSPPPEQPIAPAASEPSALLGDQAQAPAVTAEPWKQRGLASWYGKRFNGRRTASGERFRSGGFTAAHRTLPIPSYVRVRRVASGEEVIVRINDRGPFHRGRVLDLSYAAANKLGILSLGSAEVEIELLTEEEWRFSGKSSTASILRK